MRAQDLSPPQRRLLRLVAKSEPRPTTIIPGEEQAARQLAEMGLVSLERTFGGKHPAAAITEAGRRAL